MKRSIPPPIFLAHFPIGKSLNASISQHASLQVLYALIKSPVYKNLTKRARDIRKKSLKNYQLFKEAAAPVFMPHASLKSGAKKSISNCKTHTGFLAIEYDKLSKEQLASAKEAVKKVPWVAMAYTSLSGRGICVLVYTPTLSTSTHNLYYSSIALKLDNILGLCHDPSGSTLNRLRFFAHDPAVYLNPNPIPCPIELEEEIIPPTISSPSDKDVSSKEYRLICSAYKTLKGMNLSYFTDYTSWMQGAYALYNSFGTPLAAELYHKLASLSSCYNYEETEKKLTAIKKSILLNQESSGKKLGFGTLIYLFKKAAGAHFPLKQFFRNSLQGPAGKVIDFKDPYRKELSTYCPGTAAKVRQRRAAILRYIHRYAGLSPLAPHLSKIEALAERFEVSLSVISKDLSALQEAGLISISLHRPGAFSRAHTLSLTEKTLDILCEAKKPDPSAFERETRLKNSHTSESSAFSKNPPLYINIPLGANGVSLENPERSEDLFPEEPKILKNNKKEEIPASAPFLQKEREGARGGKTLFLDTIYLDPELLSLGRKAWELFCKNLRKNSAQKIGLATAREFARILEKYPDKILSIANQVKNIPPGKLSYWWLKDECFSLQVEGEILNEIIGPKEIQELSRKSTPPAERMVLISKPGIPFPILSLQGWQKYPLSVPNGIIYCTSINGPLYINRAGKKGLYRYGFEQIA